MTCADQPETCGVAQKPAAAIIDFIFYISGMNETILINGFSLVLHHLNTDHADSDELEGKLPAYLLGFSKRKDETGAGWADIESIETLDSLTHGEVAAKMSEVPDAEYFAIGDPSTVPAGLLAEGQTFKIESGDILD